MMTYLPENNYQQLLDNKVIKFKMLFGEFKLPSWTVHTSPSSYYRLRVEFRIWHNKEELYHIMYDPITKRRVRIDTFPVASQLINQAMVAIIPLLKSADLLRDKLFQIDYLSTLSNQLLITLIYHKKLTDDWLPLAKSVKKILLQQGIHAHIIGRSSGQKLILEQDHLDENLTIHGKHYIYRQIENSFTQPNGAINIEMLSWAINATQGATGDLLELYCGNGNFSIALAQNFNQVLATEVAKASVKAAQYNIAVNNLNNVKIARLSAQEFTEAINNVRTFKRLEGIYLTDYQFNTVLVDPPRGGLDNDTLAMVSQYENIIYISCNPLTLKNNLTTLSQTHNISHVAAFDQFPYTEHLEMAMVLSKKS